MVCLQRCTTIHRPFGQLNILDRRRWYTSSLDYSKWNALLGSPGDSTSRMVNRYALLRGTYSVGSVRNREDGEWARRYDTPKTCIAYCGTIEASSSPQPTPPPRPTSLKTHTEQSEFDVV